MIQIRKEYLIVSDGYKEEKAMRNLLIGIMGVNLLEIHIYND